MRLSVDFRYQREGEDLTDLVLQPHFGRLTWEEIYAGWESDDHQYYWRDLDYRVLPYDRTPFEASEPTKEEIGSVIRYERARLRGATSNAVARATSKSGSPGSPGRPAAVTCDRLLKSRHARAGCWYRDGSAPYSSRNSSTRVAVTSQS